MSLNYHEASKYVNMPYMFLKNWAPLRIPLYTSILQINFAKFIFSKKCYFTRDLFIYTILLLYIYCILFKFIVASIRVPF